MTKEEREKYLRDTILNYLRDQMLALDEAKSKLTFIENSIKYIRCLLRDWQKELGFGEEKENGKG